MTAYSSKDIAPLAHIATQQLAITFANVTQITYTEAWITYTDLFGNKYTIKYSDFQNQMFELLQPTNLKPPQLT